MELDITKTVGPYEVVGSQADYEHWKKMRYEGVSASNVATVLGLNKYNKETPDEFAYNFAHRVDTYTDSPSAEAGRRLERPILDWAQDISGREIVSWQELLRSKTHPWIIATPDGVTTEDGIGNVLVECKTHSVYTAKDWKQGVPDSYVAQVQTQMLVTGYRHAIVVQWSYGQLPVLHRMQWDQEVIDLIVAKSKEFWDKVVEIRTRDGVL